MLCNKVLYAFASIDLRPILTWIIPAFQHGNQFYPFSKLELSQPFYQLLQQYQSLIWHQTSWSKDLTKKSSQLWHHLSGSDNFIESKPFLLLDFVNHSSDPTKSAPASVAIRAASPSAKTKTETLACSVW